MQPTLEVTLIQSQVRWHDSAANLAQFAARIAELDRPGDIVVLPETFASGFTQEPEQQAQSMDGEAVRWMQRQSRETGAAITGSLAIAENGAFYNRLVFVAEGQVLAHYDKRHLFTLAGEHKRYRAGRERVVFEYRGWRVCPQVCYDLRFPVFSRNRNDYDLLLFVANWPSPRALAWRQLLRARAIENQCYVVGVNRVGRDGNGLDYAGDSVAVDFLGQPLADLQDREAFASVNLEADPLKEFRRKFAFWQDADNFSLHLSDGCNPPKAV